MKGLFVMWDQMSENKVELQRAVSHQLNKFIFPVLMHRADQTEDLKKF